jgi:hypothetical protein
MELLHIGKRVKFASYTGYSSWNEVLGSVSICSFELPLHIPFQSGALAQVTTPHTLTAILLSHLHALYNIIILTFVIAISLFLRRRRRRRRRRHCCSSTTAPTGGGQRCRKRWSQRGCWPRRRLHYYTKAGSRDRGLVAEGVTRIAHRNLVRSQIWSLIWRPTERSTQLQIQLNHGSSRH